MAAQPTFASVGNLSTQRYRLMHFSIQHIDPRSKARAGCLNTAHGKIDTPIFMPVGTAGTVKTVPQKTLCEDVKATIILGNTYHLYLRPGLEIITAAGGLHKFMGWEKPILTDSGGYQVYSLAQRRKLSEAGVTFKSHIDGSSHTFTPEHVVDMQRSIGADIIMPLDECTPHPCSYAYAKSSMDLTHRWLKRGCAHFDGTISAYNHYQTLFPIVQGSIYKDLREQSAETIAAQNRAGNAIGGVCHPNGMLYEVTSWVCAILPADKPRYLMGVGTPQDVLTCISIGIDMFDCVMPTRHGRNGMLFTTQGMLNIKNRKWKTDFSPLDEHLGGHVSTHYTKAYLNHLFHSKESLGAQLASIQNLTFYLWLVQQARINIIQGTFSTWKDHILKQLMERR